MVAFLTPKRRKVDIVSAAVDRPSDAERTGQDDRLPAAAGSRCTWNRRRANRWTPPSRVPSSTKSGPCCRPCKNRTKCSTTSSTPPQRAGRASAHERFQRLAVARTSRGSRPHADARSAAADVEPSPPAAWTASPARGTRWFNCSWPTRNSTATRESPNPPPPRGPSCCW